MLTDHAKEIAWRFALVSLFMVSNMVKKARPTPAPTLAMAAGGIVMGMARGSPSPLPGREEAVGEAVEGDPLMEGMELDEESAEASR